MTFTITTSMLLWLGGFCLLYLLIGLALGLLMAACSGEVEKTSGKQFIIFALSYGWVFIRRIFG